MIRLPLVLLAAVLLAPSSTEAGAALQEARAVDSAAFDGARAHSEATLVRPGTQADPRTAADIAREEQIKADARVKLETTVAQSVQRSPPKPNEGLDESPPKNGVKGGLAGLGIGLLAGGLLGYGLSRFAVRA